MRFVVYGRARVRGSKIDWEAEVEIDERLRRALHPQEPDGLRAGRLRRPFHVKAPATGRRTRHPGPAEITHPAGAIIFANSDDSWFLIEAPEAES
jgi:hypothetical protein